MDYLNPSDFQSSTHTACPHHLPQTDGGPPPNSQGRDCLCTRQHTFTPPPHLPFTGSVYPLPAAPFPENGPPQREATLPQGQLTATACPRGGRRGLLLDHMRGPEPRLFLVWCFPFFVGFTPNLTGFSFINSTRHPRHGF